MVSLWNSILTLCKSLFIGFIHFWILLHKINFCCKIPHVLFDFDMFREAFTQWRYLGPKFQICFPHYTSRNKILRYHVEIFRYFMTSIDLKVFLIVMMASIRKKCEIQAKWVGNHALLGCPLGNSLKSELRSGLSE